MSTGKQRATGPLIEPHLGIPFWNNSCSSLLEHLQQNGGLLVVPSGPNLTDCRHDSVYKTALRTADTAVMDSGYLALILRFLKRKKKDTITRISGLQILEVLLNHPTGANGSPLASSSTSTCRGVVPNEAGTSTSTSDHISLTLWVVPTVDEQQRIESYLARQGFDLKHHHFYQAPIYAPSPNTPIEDPILLERIRSTSPDWVILCIAGGKQEKLGLYLRNQLLEQVGTDNPALERSDISGFPLRVEQANARINPLNPTPNSTPHTSDTTQEHSDHLTPNTPNLTRRGVVENGAGKSRLPAILCTGAAIAFFTGGQARIPKWVDRLYLGWLARIFQSPKKYFYRYFQALRLPFVLRAWEK